MSNSKSVLTDKLQPPREFYFLTLFPEVFEPLLNFSLMARARNKGLIRTEVINIRDFSEDKHRRVDDSPYGGGEGMVLKPDVLFRAWKSIVGEKRRDFFTVMMSPQGVRFEQSRALDLAVHPKIVFVCGHYEGVDERFIEECCDAEVSIGDYILTGGELPALILSDVIARLIPGVVGNADSVRKDTFSRPLLKYPQYTRPDEFRGRKVPDILTGGNHSEIQAWRLEQSMTRTRIRRPDLLDTSSS